MSKNTTLELLEDNLNKHMEICDLKRKVKRLKTKNKELLKKVDWLMKADRLVIWNGTEWQVRHVVEGEKSDAK